MAVYVDPIQEYPLEFVAPAARRYGRYWCHMTADTPAELMAMARRLRLSPAYLQRGGSQQIMHFDLTPSKRAAAIRLGAIQITAKETIARSPPD